MISITVENTVQWKPSSCKIIGQPSDQSDLRIHQCCSVINSNTKQNSGYEYGLTKHLKMCSGCSSISQFTGPVGEHAAALIYTRLTLTVWSWLSPARPHTAKNFKCAFSTSSFYWCVAAKLSFKCTYGCRCWRFYLFVCFFFA